MSGSVAVGSCILKWLWRDWRVTNVMNSKSRIFEFLLMSIIVPVKISSFTIGSLVCSLLVNSKKQTIQPSVTPPPSPGEKVDTEFRFRHFNALLLRQQFLENCCCFSVGFSAWKSKRVWLILYMNYPIFDTGQQSFCLKWVISIVCIFFIFDNENVPLNAHTYLYFSVFGSELAKVTADGYKYRNYISSGTDWPYQLQMVILEAYH